jgi:hypothetical protein
MIDDDQDGVSESDNGLFLSDTPGQAMVLSRKVIVLGMQATWVKTERK